jgi:hypothetical protein
MNAISHSDILRVSVFCARKIVSSPIGSADPQGQKAPSGKVRFSEITFSEQSEISIGAKRPKANALQLFSFDNWA